MSVSLQEARPNCGEKPFTVEVTMFSTIAVLAVIGFAIRGDCFYPVS